jgi:hypothetical protein
MVPGPALIRDLLCVFLKGETIDVSRMWDGKPEVPRFDGFRCGPGLRDWGLADPGYSVESYKFMGCL